MKIAKAIASTSVFALTVGAVVVPTTSHHDNTSLPTGVVDATANPYIMGNLSYLFGWQLAGAADSQDEFSSTCAEIGSMGGSKWDAIGLNSSYIKEPSCNAFQSSPDPQASISNIIYYTTNIFITQLLGSFNNTEDFTYFCRVIRFIEVDGFLLSDTAVIGAVCQEAGRSLPPRPEGISGPADVNRNATAAARNTASILFATILAAGAETDSMLSIDCAHAPDHVANLDIEMLNGTLVEATLCNITSVLSIHESRGRIFEWNTRLFITIIESISNVGGYLNWLCSHLDAHGMQSVGLLGPGAVGQVCLDSQTNVASS